ncbi:MULTISPECIES: HAMP domain-containing sensor histidine kinase [Caulobacter]|uniref:histidine kinase n=1 Tax=Caulobacter vibrioides OR37 TaxID=1292034 RepID=R0EHA1_CAUVI|nr:MULTISPECIES: HAMP domain-containing sensor histidine kinase [Caulobacter]ENZ80607.1 signal transduction histidine kinase [Caulobacter vibrioides OR37]MBQ1561558.1 HAMP domain-containing histidine kinase [Caulobacter sp.]
MEFETLPDPIRRPAARAAGMDPAQAWRLGWLASVCLAAAAALFLRDAAGWPVWAALGAGAVPALASLAFTRDDERTQSILLVLWAMGGSLAAVLTGGVSGAMAAWCLAPVAAASTLDQPKRLAEGAALALIGGCVAALTQLSGLAPSTPAGPLAFVLGFLALVTTGLGLAAGLLIGHRRQGARGDRYASEIIALETLLDGLPSLAIAVRGQGAVTAVRGAPPPGVTTVDLFNRGLTAAAAPGDRQRLTAAIAQALRDGAASLTFNPALGVERVVALDLQRVAPNQLVGLLRDVTAERNRESALDQARADAEALAAGRARFLANMSHELRTPLNAIMGFSDIMRAKMFGPLTDRYAEYAELIHESGGHLLDLINDVLDMSKIEAERFELQRGVFDAREAVQAAMRLLRVQSDTAGVQLRGVLPPGELEVDADRRALKQIVLNLVSNALKFTPRGGQVTVTAHGYDGVLEIVVADTGVGISPEDLERLGRPYEQAGGPDQRARGTGLGLSLVRAFAKLHGGEMSIESRLGAGTSVSVRLPVLLAPLKPAEATDAANTEPRPAPTEAPKPAASLGDNVIAFAALRRD